MKKVLINLVTCGRNGVPIPWLLKFKELERLGCNFSVFGGVFLKDICLKNVDVYKFNESFEEVKKISADNQSKFGFVNLCLKRNFRAIRSIRTLLRSNFDIVYSPSSVLDLVILPFLLKLFSKKIVWATVFDNIVPFTDPGNKFIRFLAWIFFQISILFIKKADIIFVSRPELMEYLIKRKFNKQFLVSTGFAIENDLIKQAHADDKYIIDALFVGRINETKGIYDMLKILELVKQKYDNFQFAIMGQGDKKTEAQFKKKINERHLENNVQFLGFKTGLEKFNIIKSAKCFWFFSKSESESFGIALLEAVCSAKPAFSYDLEPFKNIYKNNEVFMFKKGDYQSAAAKVVDVFDNQEFNNQNGPLLLEKYSWDAIAKIEFNSFK